MNNETELKTCEKCAQTKPLDKYRKRSENSYAKTCKKCMNEMDKIRKKNLRQKKAETFLAKCEKCNEEKVLKDFAKLKKFYKKKICNSCYPDFLRDQKTEWLKNERKTNMNYRLKKSLAARLRNVLFKTDTTMNYIGCNIQYLREWFEFNFNSEMNLIRLSNEMTKTILLFGEICGTANLENSLFLEINLNIHQLNSSFFFFRKLNYLLFFFFFRWHFIKCFSKFISITRF